MPPDEIPPWTVKKVPIDVRNAAVAAAGREHQNVGEWVSRAILEKIQADQGRPRVPAVVEQPAPTVAPAAAPQPTFSLADISHAAASLRDVKDDRLYSSLAALLRSEVRAHRVAAGHLKPRAVKQNGSLPPADPAPAG